MKRNHSYTYLLPLLADKVYFDQKILACIKETYIFNQNSTYSHECFIIKARFDESQVGIEDRMMDSPNFLDCHNLIDGSGIYTFEFPEKYKEDRHYFITGKYSYMSTSSKKTILQFWTKLYGQNPTFVTGALMKIRRILFKDEKLREKMMEELGEYIGESAELGQLINRDKETFDFEGIKDIVN